MAKLLRQVVVRQGNFLLCFLFSIFEKQKFTMLTSFLSSSSRLDKETGPKFNVLVLLPMTSFAVGGSNACLCRGRQLLYFRLVIVVVDGSGRRFSIFNSIFINQSVHVQKKNSNTCLLLGLGQKLVPIVISSPNVRFKRRLSRCLTHKTRPKINFMGGLFNEKLQVRMV